MVRRFFWIPLLTLATSTTTAMAAAKKKLAKQFLNPGPKPPGYTHTVTSPPGKMIFVSGQGGTGLDDGKMPPDFATQAHNTFKHLERCLKLGGATFADVVKINYYLKDISNLTELRKIRAQYLNMDAPPAATAIQTGLSGDMLLEVEVTAIVPE